MYKGYKNLLFYKDQTNKSIVSLPYFKKCSKCSKLNPALFSPASNNIQLCIYCGNPFYVIKII